MLIPHLYGTTNHPPLLLLHAGGTLHSVWQPFIREWSQHFYIFAPDLFVDLASANPLQALALEIRAWLDENAVGQVDVIGTSLGANVALSLAIEDPQRIKHLVLDSGQQGTETPPMPLVMLTKILRGVFWVMPQALITRALMSQFKGYSQADRELLRAEMTRLGKYGFVESIEAHFSHHLANSLHRITVPTLILEGETDLLTRQGMGEKLQQGIPNARRETIKDAGHVTFLSQPDLFRQHVEAFLLRS